MSRPSWFVWLSGTALALTLITPTPARAQQPEPPPKPAETGPPPSEPSDTQPAERRKADDDDDAVFRPLEPDFTIINLPTTLPLPVHKGNFRLTHRFNGNLRAGTLGQNASDFFGIDRGATIGFEYRFAVMKHLEAAAYRMNFDRTVQFYGKYDAFHQNPSTPFGFSALVSVEGGNNFRERYAPALGASISRTLGSVAALYAVPMWVHNSAAATGIRRETFFVGLGGQVRVRSNLFVVAEVSPRVAGYIIGDAEYGFGIEKRIGGHAFVLTFTNTTEGTTFAQIARGGFPHSLYLGFNLARKFF